MKQHIQTWLRESNRILISTHQLPDGDGLGAEYALFHYLQRAKKDVRVCNPDPLPKRYQFLDQSGETLMGPDQAHVWDSFDLWIIVDTHDPTRLGALWKEFSPRAKRVVFLDHHPDTNDHSKTPIVFPEHATVCSEPHISSIAELLYSIFGEMKLATLDRDIATGLYVSVMTDTNSFRYARTTPEAHHIAAEMIQLGVNPEEIYQNIFSSKDVGHLQLLGNLLQGVKQAHSGKIAWLELSLHERKKYNATADDTLSFLNLLLLLKDAEVICLFREEDDGKIRVSLRSKGRVLVNQVAAELGGGGHDYAAGFAVNGTMKHIVDEVIHLLGSLPL